MSARSRRALRQTVRAITIVASAALLATSLAGGPRTTPVLADTSGCGPTVYEVDAHASTTDAYFCFTGTVNTQGQGPFVSLRTSVPDRIWLHQHADWSGWNDCFQHAGGVYTFQLSGRDTTPGSIQLTANTTPCHT